MYTLGSLFTGIGGIDLAFEREGFEIAYQVEIDDYCNKVLAKHWPNVKRYGDIRTVTDLPAVDVLAGGFPCQDISNAGKGAGIKEGTRSGLWFQFARIIGEVRPRIAFLENVAAITSRDGTRVIADLAALGYSCEWGIVPASAAGAAHRRNRWWCVASANVGERQQRVASDTRQPAESGGVGLADAKEPGLQNVIDEPARPGFTSRSSLMAHTASVPDGLRQIQRDRIPSAAPRGSVMGYATIEGLQGPMQPAINDPFTVADQPESQSVLGRAINGISTRMDGYIPIAGPGEEQYPWEAPRTVPRGLPNRPSMLEALGNSVYVPLVQAFAAAVRIELEKQDRL